MQRARGFVLYVNNQTKAVGISLEEAQRLAAPFIREKRPPQLRIESAVAPAPSQIWNFDHAIGQWVERS